MENIFNSLFENLSKLGNMLASTIKTFITIFLLILIIHLIASLCAFFIKKALQAIHIDRFFEKTRSYEILTRAEIIIKPSLIIYRFVYWVLLMLFLITVILTWSQTGGTNVPTGFDPAKIQNEINAFVQYLPALFSGIALFIIGINIANLVHRIILIAINSLSLAAAKMVSKLVYYFLVIITVITSLNQIGIDTGIISLSLIVGLGAIFLAASISYGFASKDVLSNMLAAFFSRKNYEIGQKIKIDDIEGVIIKINNISITIQTPSDKVIIPSSDLINKQVHIL